MTAKEKTLMLELSNYLHILSSQGVERANKIIPVLPTSDEISEDLIDLIKVFLQVVDMHNSAYQFQKQLAAGDLSAEVDKMNFLAMPLRSMQSSLKHLTWQTTQVANGNLNQTIHFLGEFADSFNNMVSALKEKEIMQARLLHSQKMESVGQLAVGIAHEINTPTQFINTNLDFVKESVSDIERFISELEELIPALQVSQAERITTALEKMDWKYLQEELPKSLNESQQGIEQISSIISSLKAFSCKQTSEKTQGNLNELIKTTMTVSTNMWKATTTIETQLAQDIPKIPILDNEVGQVILIILINAVQAIDERYENIAEKGKIEITTQLNDDTVQMTLKDNGCGMPETVRKRIFEPFFTTKDIGQGSGQGLNIAYDVIVNKHNGRIEYTSNEDQGTSAVIYLPLK